MADDIQRTIYKLEIDDSGYIRGVENMSSSTNKFAEIQNSANKALHILENALKEQSNALQKAKRDLDAYTGSDEAYRKQLSDTYKQAQADNQKLSGLVAQSRKEYEAATKAAQDFANTSAKATQLQQQTTGGKIPVQAPPSVAAGLNAQIFNTVDLTQFGELAEITAKTKTEFDELRDSIQLAEERMKQLSEDDEEFKHLALVVDEAKIALNHYAEFAHEAEHSTGSLKNQLRLTREELVRLEDAGKSASKEYVELEQKAAKLTDQFNDQQQRIKILASDTKLLDFGKASITAATSAFQAYTSVSILAGGANEELQKKTLQLFAAMQLLQSLEQLSNLTRREGQLATLAQAGAQSVYTAVVGASTGALRAFRLALLATGIGAAIVGIGFLVSKYNQLRDAAKEASERQKLFKEVNEEAAKSVASQVTKLEALRLKLNDLNVPQKERVAIAKEYNKTADETNKIDLKQIDNLELINQKIAAQNKLIIARALSTAALSKITEASTKVVELQLQVGQEAQKRGIPEFEFLNQLQAAAAQGDELVKNLDLSTLRDRKVFDAFQKNIKEKFGFNAQQVAQLIDLVKSRNAAQGELKKITDTLAPLITTEGLVSPETIKKTDTKTIENVFAEKLKELQAKLAEVTAKSFESEGTIRKQFAASLEKEIASINDLVKAKKLTKGQSEILIDLLVKINAVQLDQALGEFNKKILDARKKLNDELRELQNKQTQDSINLIQDEFEKRAAQINFSEQKELSDAEEHKNVRLEALETQHALGLLSEQQYQDAKNKIVKAGEDEQDAIIIQAARQRQDLAADSFQKSLQVLEDITKSLDLVDDQEAAKKIRAASDSFIKGKISYEKYKKDLDKIQRDYSDKSRNRELSDLRYELSLLDSKIATTEDKTSKHYKKLLELREELSAKITSKEIEDAQKDAEDKNATKRKETVEGYVESIGKLTDSIVAFWQKANEAEAAALDRSIALQEKRVDAAQRIAERGNAQYLKAEEDRLKELQIQRENAARRQLAIDAALQASQLLVGITGAIAKIASGIGVVETIAEIAVIVSALATGYGLVKSLQGNQPRLKGGTKYLTRDKEPSGTDTIPAWLNEGEAVIPTEKNKAYHPTVSAIYDGTIPAEHINSFVTNYTTNKSFTTQNAKTVNDFVTNNHKIKTVAQPNYQRIKEAAQSKSTEDSRTAIAISEQNKLLLENNELLRLTHRALKSMGVNVNVDKNGLAVSVMEVIEQVKINQKV